MKWYLIICLVMFIEAIPFFFTIWVLCDYIKKLRKNRDYWYKKADDCVLKLIKIKSPELFHGSYNTAIGCNANYLISGSRNVAVGYKALYNKGD